MLGYRPPGAPVQRASSILYGCWRRTRIVAPAAFREASIRIDWAALPTGGCTGRKDSCERATPSDIVKILRWFGNIRSRIRN